MIDKSKLSRLLDKIAKEFSRKGASIKSDDISVPWDDSTGKSKGYVLAAIYDDGSLHEDSADLSSLNSKIPMMQCSR